MLHQRYVLQLVLGIAVSSGCGSGTKKPEAGDAPRDSRPVLDDVDEGPVVADAAGLIKSVTVEMNTPLGVPPVHATVRGVANSVGTAENDRHINRVGMRVECDIGGTRYTATSLPQLVESFESFESADTFFGGHAWEYEGPLGDCDAWLTIRQVYGSIHYREFVIAARCRRDDVWGVSGCRKLPEGKAPQPLGDSPIEVEMLKGAPQMRDDKWRLVATLEYKLNQSIHSKYQLGATVRCSAGAETVEYWYHAADALLFDLRPGDVTRSQIGFPSNIGLLSEPQQCELDLALRSTDNEFDKRELGTFCWTPAGVEPGECVSG